MTAGTVVIIGGLLAAFILLTIVSVLCYCRLQYYCCKEEDTVVEEEEDSSSEEEVEEEEEEDPEEEETDISLSPEPPSPPDYFARPYTPPPSGPPSPPLFGKHILSVGALEANGPSCLPGGGGGYPSYRGIRRPPGYALCQSCSGLLPHHMHRHDAAAATAAALRNGGSRVQYQRPHSHHGSEAAHSDHEMFRKANLIRWVAMHGVVAHRSFSTEV